MVQCEIKSSAFLQLNQIFYSLRRADFELFSDDFSTLSNYFLRSGSQGSKIKMPDSNWPSILIMSA